MNIQAIIFEKKYYTAEKARKWLKDHNYQPIKHVDKTTNFLRYRIQPPKRNVIYKFFDLSNNEGVKFILMFPK